MEYYQFVYIFLLLVNVAFVKKILGVFPSPGYSQFILCESLMSNLAQKGHEVTIISAYKPEKEIKNLKAVRVESILKSGEGDLFELENLSPFQMELFFNEFTLDLTEKVLSNDKVQELTNSNATFDLVIIEQFGNEAHLGFAKHFNATLISFSSIGLSDWNSHLVGNVRLPSVNPLTNSRFNNRMSFGERLQNSVLNVFVMFTKYYVVFPKHQELMNRYFPNKMDIQDVMNDVSLLLTNSHVAVTNPILLTSAVVEIGGFYIQTKKLPEEIQKFLDGADHGAIFFSLGSNLRSKDLTKEKLNAILTALSKIKQRILWKFEGDIPNKPDNLYVSKWLPQTDILAHPKTIGFITHCGLLSTTESTFFGVPMIGIPIFADQKLNLRRAVQRGTALHVPFGEISDKTLSKALDELVNNPSYRNEAKKYSAIMKDRIVHPLDLAIHWIEHVDRHGGSYLRNASMDLNWFQLYLLDVVGFLVICLALVVFVLRFLIKAVLCRKELKLKRN